MTLTDKIRTALTNRKDNSAWTRGVTKYALDLLDDFEETVAYTHIDEASMNKDLLLNGATNWLEYSYGGNSLIYDGDIAERLCSPSELKRKKNGDLPPNSYEDWLEVQARALTQASNLLLRTCHTVMEVK